MPSTGWQLPGYTEERELGVGTQGRVVLARAEETSELVAIKYLAERLLGSPRARVQFRNEAELLSRLTDTHVALLFDYVETTEGTAIVMEAVNGSSLRTLLNERAPLAPEAALATLKGSLLGLAAAHAVGVVHRDYKPANVVVQEDGQSKLIDFGIALLTGQSSKHGTPQYMAPEQWQGQPSSPATDIYAATCVFFECVTSAKPYNGTNLSMLMAQHLKAPVPVDAVPEPLRPLVASGMAKDPGQRLWDARALVAELESIAASAYGRDWERHGLKILGGTVAVLAAAAPLGLVGSALLAPGASAGSGVGAAVSGVASQAPSAASQPVAEAGSKGLLAKVGGAKGAAGIGAATTTAILITLLLWPSAPSEGGESHGSFRAYFTQPGILLGLPNMPPAETPYMKLAITVSPARARADSKIRVITHFQAKTLHGVKYLPNGRRQCFGNKSNRTDINDSYNFTAGGEGAQASEQPGNGMGFVELYRVPPARIDRLPVEHGMPLTGTKQMTAESQPYNFSICGFLSNWTEVRVFIIPDRKVARPGRYLLSPSIPPRISKTSHNGTDIPPVSAGATSIGNLPVLTILHD